MAKKEKRLKRTPVGEALKDFPLEPISREGKKKIEEGAVKYRGFRQDPIAWVQDYWVSQAKGLSLVSLVVASVLVFLVGEIVFSALFAPGGLFANNPAGVLAGLIITLGFVLVDVSYRPRVEAVEQEKTIPTIEEDWECRGTLSHPHRYPISYEAVTNFCSVCGTNREVALKKAGVI